MLTDVTVPHNDGMKRTKQGHGEMAQQGKMLTVQD